jgi:hypothetical protein
MKAMKKVLMLSCIGSIVSACQLGQPNLLRQDLPPHSENRQTHAQDVVAVQRSVDKLPVKTLEIPTITGVGFSSISVQPGKSLNQKRIMAIKAARLDALRQLTEQIHGIQINSSTKIAEAVIQSDTLRADLQGVILGARTVKIEPNSSDTYEVVVEIDRSLINQIIKAYR